MSVADNNHRAADVRLFRAPGRVNIIGEHTDYNDGLVLPTNTAIYTRLSIRERDDRIVHVNALNFDESASFNLDDIGAPANEGWIDYVRGVAAVLADEGVALPGVEMTIEGDIPIGGGLSSSASLELAVAVAFLDVAEHTLPPSQVAKLCQIAEQKFAGVNCGIMDQYSIACGKWNQAMKLDCRSMATEFVDIPENIALLVTDSGVKHQLPDSGYNKRSDECTKSVRILAETDSNIATLRDVSMDCLKAGRTRLGETLYRRSYHVVTEIQRVRDAFEALRTADSKFLGELVGASHDSLRDNFEVSCDEVETLVDISNNCSGTLGSRMVGAGFGGCVLTVTEATRADDVATEIGEKYAAILGRQPWTHRVAPTGPAAEVVNA